MVLSPKMRRLENDFNKLKALAGKYIHIDETRGNPPNEYILSFTCTGQMKDGFGNLVKTNTHRCRMSLDGEYPRFKPKLEWLTPIFHPNFFKGGGVCIGDDWAPNYHIDNYVLMLGEMVQYKVYNVDSPANPEAAAWAKEHTGELPIGTENILEKEGGGSGTAPSGPHSKEFEIKIF